VDGGLEFNYIVRGFGFWEKEEEENEKKKKEIA